VQVGRSLATCTVEAGLDGRIEVTHVHNSAGIDPEGRAMWFYLAHGSGLWLRARDLLFVGGSITRRDDTQFLHELTTAIDSGKVSAQVVAVRHKCEAWGPLPRVELVLWRTSARPEFEFMAELCAAGRFSAGWPPGARARGEACRCAWTTGGGAISSLRCL
jgi:hypothetical protein